MWEERCYFEGIPDSVPDKLLFSGRAPSWKAIAICILNNDHALTKMGLSKKRSAFASRLVDSLEGLDSDQMSLL